MLGIGLEWWILYVFMLIGLFFLWLISLRLLGGNLQLRALFKGLDIIHRDMEEIKEILRDME